MSHNTEIPKSNNTPTGSEYTQSHDAARHRRILARTQHFARSSAVLAGRHGKRCRGHTRRRRSLTRAQTLGEQRRRARRRRRRRFTGREFAGCDGGIANSTRFLTFRFTFTIT